MYQKSFIFSFLALWLLASPVSAQENRTDEQGLKQGRWIKRYPHGTTMYNGTFRDDHPVGEFRRYYENGILQSVLVFSDDGVDADAVFYYQNGKPASKGRYKDKLKEGNWQFFAPDSNYVMSEESYSQNRRQGLSSKYYRNGRVAEEIFYIDDRKNGEWNRYYENGQPWLKAFHKDNMLNGKYEAWHENGKLQVSGEYRNDRRNGHWQFFDANGTIIYNINYIEGIPDNRQMEIDAADFIDSLEKMKGSLPDPEKTGDMW